MEDTDVPADTPADTLVSTTPFAGVYLDNNATTRMPPEVTAAMNAWLNRGNPSSGYRAAERSRALIMAFRRYIGDLLGVRVCCDEDRDGDPAANVRARRDSSMYKVIVTSGASESNSAAITGVVAAYNRDRASALVPRPNVIVGATEHKSVLKCVDSLVDQGLCTRTTLWPDRRGVIAPSAVADAIGPFTCLVVIMAANNELGTLADVDAIGAICRRRGVHYHCDAVQAFGKMPPRGTACDSLSLSFHKLHGPTGVGALVLRQSARWLPLVHGAQNEQLRGGTENMSGIAGAYMATRMTMHMRGRKNAHLLRLKHYLLDSLATSVPTLTYEQYANICDNNARYAQTRYTVHDVLPAVAADMLVRSGIASPQPRAIALPRVSVVILTPHAQSLPNTVLLAVVKRDDHEPLVCNADMRKELERNGVIVSVGSACNTADPKASHVLYAIGADKYVRRGCLRVSFGDDNTRADIDAFLRVFLRLVDAHVHA